MPYALSFLDKSPLHDGDSATEALQRTLALARRAEELGFSRFWVAEHHNAPKLASSSPEVLISFLLARTNRIRIGSGGVMLQHYSAYKVAENFNLLAALAPGRVDLGIGKAPGGMPLSTNALQGAYDPARKPSFETQLTELDGFLRHEASREGGQDWDDAGGHLAAYPAPVTAAERFLLGASPDSARLAARLGWNFVYPGHIHGDATAIAEAISTYRDAGGRSALLAVSIVTAETEAEANRLAGDSRRFRVEVENAQSVNVGSREQALEYVRQVGASRYRIEERTALVIRGTPARVHAELDRLHRTFGIDEFIVDCPETEGSQRLKTIELLAAAHVSLAA
ncbi:LLM class flavin-dependent oxidoreductase [Bosea caraganae]|uniref:LLM class flavin-dependent oxidoreductase n=1 Tax=Bosea caraganae TaxID=2763117 RepID=A0A370L2F3_9HYPH|nr:LLM class flavin-dependent oxidoreductase [Bosea caraganae]RDJ22415.1 LLM class flavin-dependent oxidoreductase [Bosea caraganae]RDJ30374.1 LLM class flavin-dependent oxidoreductase [Bosea caraganae]